MINHYKQILISLLFLFQNSFSSAQVTVTFKPDSAIGKDAFLEYSGGCIFSGRPAASELVNFGTHPELYYMQWTYSSFGCGQGTQRTLIKFTELSTLPASATIISAQLNLFGGSSSGSYGTSYYPGSPYPLTNEGWAERVTSPWNEFIVTWNTQPTTTTVNRAAISPTTAHWNWVKNIDVTTLIQDIISSGSNEGLMLKLQNEAIYRSVVCASSDNPNPALWPELVITYLDDPCAGTIADFKDTNTSCYTFQFSDLSKTKDSGIVSWNWDFGDMTTGAGKNPAHTYPDYGSYNVRLIVTDSSGCRDTILKPVTVNYKHFANAGRDTTLCLLNGSATTFLRGNRGSIHYAWTPNAGALSHPNSTNTYATISSPSTFYLTVTDSFGCIDKDTVNVGLFPKSALKITPKDTAVCLGTLLKLQASGAKSYIWFPVTGLDSPTTANPTLIVKEDVNYIVSGTDLYGCKVYDTAIIKLLPSVPLFVTPKNAIGCEGEVFSFTASGATSYKWTPSLGLSSDSIANPQHVINGKATYIVHGINEFGCDGIDTVFVNQYPNPKVDAYSNENIVLCMGKTVQLNVTGASSYIWSPAEFCNDANSNAPNVSPSQTTLFTVTGTNDNGCKATDTISVIYAGTSMAYVPNSFSPNHDGINDRIGIIDDCNFNLLALKIYNRWGKEVFMARNENERWDGTTNGKDCEAGVYYYLIKGRNLNNEDVMFKGDITLIR